MATYKRLDETGLALVWAKVKAYVTNQLSSLPTYSDICPVGAVYHSTDPVSHPCSSVSGTWTGHNSPYIYEEDIQTGNNVWSYRKWSDGTLECWARFYISSMNISTTTGQLKYGNVTISDSNYPVAFIEYPVVQITGQVSGGNGWVVGNNTNYSKTSVGGLVAYSSLSRTGVGVTVNIYAIGKWTTSNYPNYRWVHVA